MGLHIGHVALQVTDAERSANHATATLGLQTTLLSHGSVYLTANEKHHELQLIGAARPGLDHIGLEVDDAHELDLLRDRLIRHGATIVSEEPLEPGLAQAIRCEGPAGITFELYAGMERRPLSVESVLRPLVRKFGHVTLASDEKSLVEQFLIHVLGFEISDRLSNVATWLRCDPDHHGIAIASYPEGSYLHHYAFAIESFAAMGQYADHIAALGQRFIWGPGRHGPGFNHFSYLPDPDGIVIEVYSDLLRIDSTSSYAAIDWDGEPGALNLWGPPPPDNWNDLGVPVLTPKHKAARPDLAERADANV